MITDLLRKFYFDISNLWEWWWESSNNMDELARVILTILIVAVAILWFKWTFMKSRKGIAPLLPPGPHGLPILGYLPFLGPNLHEIFTEMAQSYGPVFKLWLGSKLYVVVNSPSLAKEVVRDQDLSFANRDPPIAALAITYGGRDIVWSNIDSYWRNTRKVFAREVLSSANLSFCYSFRREEVRKTIKNLFTKVGTGVDINEVSFFTELNVITSMLWGSTVEAEGNKTSDLKDEFKEVIFEIVEVLGKPNISDYVPILSRFDLQGVERQAKMVAQRLDRILDSIIEERIKFNSTRMDCSVDKEGRKDFLQILLELKDQEDTAKSLSMTQIKAILVDIVVGGTDSTATTIEWAMAELMNNPEAMKKVQDELTEVIGLDNTVEEFHMPKLHYLDAVIKETLRLYPPVPFLTPRCPNQACTVGGYTVPKGTRVFLNVWALHRDAQNWDNPSQFMPERFLNDSRNNLDYSGNNYSYVPFGSGRRICAGITLAEKMLMYILSSLLHAFDWSLPEGEKLDLSERFGFVLKKRTPLVAAPSQRLHNLSLYM